MPVLSDRSSTVDGMLRTRIYDAAMDRGTAHVR